MCSKQAIINVRSLIGADIRSRSNGALIEERVAGSSADCRVVLDFEGVDYISRSFADELCELAGKWGGRLELRGMAGAVGTMYETVLASRGRKRVRGAAADEIYTFTDIESLSRFLQTV